ncbi:MAG: baseplate J/gp47 family protein, partial [Methylobacter sp.]
NPALETPQGQLATTLASIIADKNAQIANIANQVNPDFSSGRWQDAIARIYFIDRIPAQGTVVQATCIGLQGVVIPVGSLAKDSSGNVYSCTQAGTIPNTGSIVLSFTCTTPGAIACPAGTLTTIYKAIPGWDTINNLTDGVVGNPVESREEFETRRQASVAASLGGNELPWGHSVGLRRGTECAGRFRCLCDRKHHERIDSSGFHKLYVNSALALHLRRRRFG